MAAITVNIKCTAGMAESVEQAIKERWDELILSTSITGDEIIVKIDHTIYQPTMFNGINGYESSSKDLY